LRLVGEIDNAVIEEMLEISEKTLNELLANCVGDPESAIGMVKAVLLPPGTSIIILLLEEN